MEAILNIERGGEKPRKDYEKYSDVYDLTSFFYDEDYNALDIDSFPFNYERFDKELIKDVLSAYATRLNLDLSEEEWFNDIKKLTVDFGFADNVKVWKKNKEAYPGHVGDIAEMIRIAITGRKQTPNLYNIFKVLGLERSKARLLKVINSL